MIRRTDEPIRRQAPRMLTDVLDASGRDIAAGHVGDAAAAQHEARTMLVDFEKACAGANAAVSRGRAKMV